MIDFYYLSCIMCIVKRKKHRSHCWKSLHLTMFQFISYHLYVSVVSWVPCWGSYEDFSCFLISSNYKLMMSYNIQLLVSSSLAYYIVRLYIGWTSMKWEICGYSPNILVYIMLLPVSILSGLVPETKNYLLYHHLFQLDHHLIQSQNYCPSCGFYI